MCDGILEGLDDFINQLEQGDIIMHHAHGFVSETIRVLEGSDYNHCSIYDKDGYVYESVTGGVVRKKLCESICTQNTSAVTNLRLKNLPKDKSLLIETIEKHHTSDVYAYDQIVLLAMILLKKKLGLNNKNTSSFTEKLLIYTADKLTGVFDPNNKNEICSELIYRAYEEVANLTGNTNFHLNIDIHSSMIPFDGKNINDAKEITKIRNRAKAILKKNNSLRFDITHYRKLRNQRNQKNKVTLDELEKDFKRILPRLGRRQQISRNRKSAKNVKLLVTRDMYNKEDLKNWEENIKYFEKTNPETAALLKRIDVYNFITPANISEHSFNTQKLNTFKTGIEYDSNCPFCAI